MQKNTMLIAIVIIAVIIIGAFAATYYIPKGPTQTAAIGDKSTKLAFYDKGNCWIHSVAVIWDVKTNGTTKPDTYFADMWMKPNETNAKNLWDLQGKEVIDLSQTLGYSNNPLPAGTTMRVKVFSDILSNQYAGQMHMFQSAVQSWSNSPTPQSLPSYSTISDLALLHQVYTLPANIKDNSINMTSDPAQGAVFLQGIKCVIYEFILTVNPDGTVTINMTKNPELCNNFAGNWQQA